MSIDNAICTSTLVLIISEIVGIDEEYIDLKISPNDIVVESLKIALLMSSLNEKGYTLNIKDFYESKNISELANKIGAL